MMTPVRIASTLIGAQLVMAGAFGLAMPVHAHAIAGTVTVDGTEYPLCATEDCSDQPNQVGVWRNDGRDWLIIGESTYPIIP